MIKRYKVLKDCLDASGSILPAGYEFEIKDIKIGINSFLSGGEVYKLTHVALKNTDYFEEVKEEKVRVEFHVKHPNGELWNFGGHGKIKREDYHRLYNEMTHLFYKFTREPVKPEPPENRVEKFSWWR